MLITYKNAIVSNGYPLKLTSGMHANANSLVGGAWSGQMDTPFVCTCGTQAECSKERVIMRGRHGVGHGRGDMSRRRSSKVAASAALIGSQVGGLGAGGQDDPRGATALQPSVAHCVQTASMSSDRRKSSKLSRPGWYSAGLIVAISAAFLMISVVTNTPAVAAGKPLIQVGIVLPLTGVESGPGNYEKDGFQLGLHRYGQSIDGHRIDVHYTDSHGTASAALADAKLLVQSDHVQLIESTIVSPAAIAVDSYALPHGVPVTDVSLAAADFTKDYNKYGIGQSSGWTDYQPASVAATYAYATLKWRHVVTIAVTQQFGYQSVGGFATEFRKMGGTIDKTIWVPESSAADIATFISEIPHTTQGVFAVLPGSLGANFINEYSSFGLSKEIPVIAMQATDQTALVGEKKGAAIGTLSVSQYCTGLPNQLNKVFVKEYQKNYGLLPSFYSDLGYVKAEILDKALIRLRGVVKNPKELGRAMRDVRIAAPRGPVAISTITHSAVENLYICRVKTVGGSMRNVLVKTYKDMPPWGLLSKSAFKTDFAQQSIGQPSS